MTSLLFYHTYSRRYGGTPLLDWGYLDIVDGFQEFMVGYLHLDCTNQAFTVTYLEFGPLYLKFIFSAQLQRACTIQNHKSH